jgi:peptide/nickel transport system substrate-binding protein
LEQLEASGDVTVHQGRSYSIDAMIVANFNGVLGDDRVRRALSMALDRESLAQALYKGAASPAKALATPGQWGYARQKFAAAWEALPATTVDLAEAKRLVQEAGAVGKTVVLADSSELKDVVLQNTAFGNAAKSIGLKVRLTETSAANYFNYFIDPKARETVDAFSTVNLADWAEPASMYQAIALPEGISNYNGYHNPRVISLLEEARETADLDKRAGLIIEAQKLIVHDLPWIPTVAPVTLLALRSELTGAVQSSAYLFAPWADDLGGK